MALLANDLTKKYGDKTVLDHLSFKIEEPGVYALLGTNGAGKTTALRILLGMLNFEEGRVTWKGKPLDPTTSNVGYLPEERGLYPKYTIMDQLLYFAKLKNMPRKEAKEKIAYWSERLDVEDYVYPSKLKKNKKKFYTAEQLSKGNQQKIQLMIALLSDPELLILDEPLSGLDPVNSDLFKSIIREEINKGKYLIMSSHQMPVIEEFCEDITILNRGKTVLQGNLNEIKKGYGRVNLFLRCEGDILPIIKEYGLSLVSQSPMEYHIRVEEEETATLLLRRLIEEQIPVIKFELREPSLHEIFVEKVGVVDDEE
ncbi:MAG: ATP-binding cassette domain-containing protein [Clostridiales bacterium]|nr:ATP-binding cassette domain-containing protein [Clostridiales bacterium]